MARHPNRVPANFSVKLSEELRLRVGRAMEVSGSHFWSEFCRASLLDRCRKIETELKATHPREYLKIYGKEP